MSKLKSLITFTLVIGIILIGCNEDDPEIKITSFSFDTASVEVIVGSSVDLNDHLTIEGEDANKAEVVFSSDDDEVVEVKGTTLTAVGVGVANVEATETNTNKSATIEVTVLADEVEVTGVSLDEESFSLVIGETKQLTATVAPDDATEDGVTWSVEFPSEGKKSNDDPTEIATVSEEGLVTAVAPGEIVVLVTTDDGEFTDSATVTVEGISVTEVTLDQTEVDLEIGETVQLTATISPDDATEQGVTWSVDFPSDAKVNEAVATDIATVSDDGLVTAVAAGEVVVTVTTKDGDFTATANITVNNIAVTGIAISPDPVEIEAYESVQLTATVSPEDATIQTVTWGVAMTEAAGRVSVAALTVDDYLEIDDDGLLTALARCDDCTFTVTATSTEDEVSKTVDVTITYIPVTSITLDPSSVFELHEGWTKQMDYTISPSNATDQEVTWEISTIDDGNCGDARMGVATTSIDDYATIDENGLLSAHMQYSGRCVRLAVMASSVDDVSTTVGFDITIPVESLTILDNEEQDAGTSIDMPDCSSYQLDVSVSPGNASDQTVTWTSENTDVLIVDSTGKLTLNYSEIGDSIDTTVKVTVTANDGSNATDSIDVVITFNGC